MVSTLSRSGLNRFRSRCYICSIFTIGSHHQLLQLFQKSIGSEYLLDFSFSNRCYRLLKRFLLTTILPLRLNNAHCKGHSTKIQAKPRKGKGSPWEFIMRLREGNGLIQMVKLISM